MDCDLKGTPWLEAGLGLLVSEVARLIGTPVFVISPTAMEFLLWQLRDLRDFLLVMMSDSLFMALMASTQRAHFLLAWNCLSLTKERTSVPRSCSIRKGWSRHWLAVSLFLPFLLSRWDMKSWERLRGYQFLGFISTLAFTDIGSNSGSSKSKRTLNRKQPRCYDWIKSDLLDNVAECLGVRVSHEGRKAGEEDVGDDPDWPHVCGGSDMFVTDNLRRHKLRGAAHSLHLLAWLRESFENRK